MVVNDSWNALKKKKLWNKYYVQFKIKYTKKVNKKKNCVF